LVQNLALCAPDNFRDLDGNPVDQAAALLEAFKVLRSGFSFAARKIDDPRQLRVMRELIEMSFEAYVAGDAKTGAHTLQECDGLIWSSRRVRLKYVVEAERRAFGDVTTYANVQVSRYPCQGTADDVQPNEAKLYALANARCLESFSRREDFKPFILVLEKSGTVRELKSRSWKGAKKDLRTLAIQGKISAFVKAEVVASGMRGVLVYTIEAPNRPQISVLCLVQNYVCESPRFHLDDPSVLVDED
jgi:hypothetical protein